MNKKILKKSPLRPDGSRNNNTEQWKGKNKSANNLINLNEEEEEFAVQFIFIYFLNQDICACFVLFY